MNDQTFSQNPCKRDKSNHHDTDREQQRAKRSVRPLNSAQTLILFVFLDSIYVKHWC